MAIASSFLLERLLAGVFVDLFGIETAIGMLNLPRPTIFLGRCIFLSTLKMLDP